MWGPALWRAIHFIALGYPQRSASDADRAAYRAFFESLDAVIPCQICATNYRRHLLELPIDDGALFDWTVNLHNLVDKELGKADHTWTPQRAREALLAGTHSHSTHQPSSSAVSHHQIVLIALVTLLAASALACLFMLLHRRRRCRA